MAPTVCLLTLSPSRLSAMDHPVIGICTSLEPVRFGVWHEVAAFSPLGA